MRKSFILLMVMFVIFACTQDCLNPDNSEKKVTDTDISTDVSKEEKVYTTLQQVVNDTNTGEEIDLSKYKDVTDYNATINKTLTIKNGSLNSAKLTVTAENVKLEKIEKVSVSTSSKLTITNSKLNSLLIGGGATSRSITLSAEMSLAMVTVTDSEIENVELNGFNSQLNITDTTTQIDDISTSTKAKVILEAGSYEGMKDPVVTDNGELTRIDMTKEKELSILSIYSNPKKTEYEIGSNIDLTGLAVMGIYTAAIEIFRSGGWKGEEIESVTKLEDEKNYTVDYDDFNTAGVKIVTITSSIETDIKCSFYVYVKDSECDENQQPEISDISVKTAGTPKTSYKVGDKLDLSSYQVIGNYNGLEINLPYTSEPVNGDLLTKEGKIEVTFFHEGKKVETKSITVTEPYPIYFYDADTLLYTIKIADGDRLQLPIPPNKVGYIFTDWYNGETKFGTDDPVTKELKLTAKWKPDTNTPYKVEHYQQNIDDDNYSIVEAATESKSGETDSDTSAIAKNYAGFTAKEFKQCKINSDGSTVVKIYYDRNKITLTFNFGDDEKNISGKYGAKVKAPTATQKNGYIADWEPTVAQTFPVKDVTYKVAWTKEGDYKITYNLNGGTNAESNPASYNVETSTVKFADATKDGYIFDGWYTDEAFNTKKIEIAEGSTGAVTLYAKWTATFYVSNSGNDENIGTSSGKAFKTLQKAVEQIQNINNGKVEYTICVESDITAEKTAFADNNNNALINISPDKTLNLKICGNSTNKATINANNAGRVMYIGENANVTIQNLTFTSGKAEDCGGGIYCNNSSFTIKDCVISSNSSTQAGGGIYINNEDTFATLIENTTIIKNESTGNSGGGIYIEKGSVYITGTNISENKSAGHGGGILNGGILTLDTTTLTSNSAAKNGGAINTTDSGTLYVKDGLSIPAGDGGKNNMYLAAGTTVNIIGTPKNEIVATITPAEYDINKQILKTEDGVTLSESEVRKIAVTPENGTTEWFVDAYGYLGKVPMTETNVDGTTVYLINSSDNMLWLAREVIGGGLNRFNIKLTDDIEIQEGKWKPLRTSFSTIDGQGHSITIREDFSNLGNGAGGLFYTFNNGIIKNLVLDGCITAKTTGDGSYIGALCRSAYRTTIQNVMSTMTVINNGTGAAGGLVGYFGGNNGDGKTPDSFIKNCAVYADVSCKNGTAGGLVGVSWANTQTWKIENCIYMGTVSSKNGVAGALIGNENTGRTSYLTDIWYCESNNCEIFGKEGNAGNIEQSEVKSKSAEEIATEEAAKLLNTTSDGTSNDAWEYVSDSDYPTLKSVN